MSSTNITNSVNKDFKYYLNKKKLFFLNGYQTNLTLNIYLQTIIYSSQENSKELSTLFIIYENDCLLIFLNNLNYIEKNYRTIGYGLISNHSLIMLSGGVKNQRKIFPNTLIYLNYNSILFLDKYEKFSTNSFSNNYNILILDRLMRTNSKILNIDKKITFKNKFHIYERKYFMSNFEAIEFGIIDNIFE